MTDPQAMSILQARATAAVSAVIGAILLIRGWEPIRVTIAIRNLVDTPTSYLTYILFPVVVGVLMLVAAGMIFLYKKRGLQVGLVAHVLYVGNSLYNVVRGGQPDAIEWLLIVLAVVGLFLCFRLLTHDPERLLFG